MTPSLSIRANIGKQFVPYLRRQLRRVFTILDSPNAHSGDRSLRARLCCLTELSIALVDDKQMSDLHLRFMNIAGPTDVLTFPIDVDESGRIITGEVVICIPQARRQSKELGVPILDELLLYALHGMLHLMGLDDRNETDYTHMHCIEDDILTRMGVGKVFHRKAKPRHKHAGRNIARGDC